MMLKITNLTKSFIGNANPTLREINLDLSHGDFCIVIGGNGSGKSTLLRCISKEYEIDSGSITKHNIASVVQDISRGTIAEMTCLENMLLSYMKNRSAKFSFYQKYEDKMCLKLAELGLGLEKFINKPLNILSGGQRQMIATLMAIISKPEILLLDEHTSALDPKTEKKLMDYTVAKIREENITTMMVTHKLEDAIKYGNRLIMLNKGEIILDVKGDEKYRLNIDNLFQLFYDCEVSHA
jgi:putative ABC transport system ATP-binding protein